MKEDINRITYWKEKTWMTMKETNGQTQSLGWNRPFIDLTSWSEEEEEEEVQNVITSRRDYFCMWSLQGIVYYNCIGPSLSSCTVLTATIFVNTAVQWH